MNKRLTAEVIFEKHHGTAPFPMASDEILEAIRDGMRGARDAALEWAAEQQDDTTYKQCILAGKHHPELQP